MRRPGSSAAVTASAVVRRTSRSGDTSLLSATSSATPSSASGSSTRIALVSSENRRVQASLPVSAFSVMSFSSGSERRWGRWRRSVRRWWRVVSRPSAVSSSSARSSSTRRPFELEEQQLGLHRRALLLDARQQRAVGGIGGVDGEAQHRVVAGAAEAIDDRLELGHGGGELGRVELADAPGVGLGEARGALVGLGQQPVGALSAVAVDQWIEVPGDLLHVHEGHSTSVP